MRPDGCPQPSGRRLQPSCVERFDLQTALIAFGIHGGPPMSQQQAGCSDRCQSEKSNTEATNTRLPSGEWNWLPSYYTRNAK